MADLPAALSSRFCSSAVCLLVPVSSAHVDNPPPGSASLCVKFVHCVDMPFLRVVSLLLIVMYCAEFNSRGQSFSLLIAIKYIAILVFIDTPALVWSSADRGNGVEMGSAIEEAGKSVIPFICDNILTCLDGYASPPTYAQCVALGPVTSERIHLDYNAAGPDSKKVKVSVSGLPENYISINKVFLWVRKARQYLNECRSLMASGENVKKPEKYEPFCTSSCWNLHPVFVVVGTTNHGSTCSKNIC